ncbi:hypothetical protein TWF694_000524 [Orbilia ellipsospora]|uniref:NF-kappa-B inhibitor-like protein 1 n=1 Tax=Orbilia ellipsospora TaxID=2528407 RepID=A0AAV9XQD2_9PEZI
MEDTPSTSGIDNAYTSSTAKKGKLKLKSKRRTGRHDDDRRRRDRDRSRSRSCSRTRSRSRSASPTSHTRKRRKKPPPVSETDDPSLYDDVYLPGQNSFKYKNPETAFQESLFEAMADDEGASYWEGVYGQPIHVYSRPKIENEKGELEMMTDEEYASYVRQRMYEKTDEYLEKEKRRINKEREREKRREEEEQVEWERRERERLYREKERRERKSSEKTLKAWAEYVKLWGDITNKGQTDGRVQVPWPVESGKQRDVSKDAIESFFRTAPEKRSYGEILRIERVRWHPDKALQRWGREKVSEEMLQGITAVFQIVDSLWAEERAGDK